MDTMDAMKKRILLKDYRNRLNNTINTEEFPEDESKMNAYISSSLGDDYFFGTDETEKDENKACFFYENSADNGNEYGQYKAGLLHAVLAMEEDDDVHFTLGIKYLCESYKNEYPYAYGALDMFVKNGRFPFKSVAALVDFFDENS